SGLLDTVDPHPFGAPQPSDGVLSAGEEISIQFNEPINIGILQNTNFTMTGELNGGSQSHPASLYFNGTDDQFVEIPSPADLSRKSFSIDFYTRRNAMGEAILFSIGQDEQNSILVGFNAADQPYFYINGEEISSTTAITDNNWHHIAATYHHNDQDASLYIDGNRVATDTEFIVDFNTTASIYLARSQFEPTRPFDGSLHELRLWNRELLESDVSKVAVSKLSAGEPGLISNWRLEDGRGTIARDNIRQKNGTISASWQIEPNGLAYEFNGTSDLLYSSSPSFSADSDFSIEFWVNADPVTDSVTFLSNGRGDNVDENQSGWSIGTDTNGLLIIRNSGGDIASGVEVADGFWHHVALTLNRFGSLAVFIDGDEVAAVEAADYPGFGGPRLWLGARGWFDGLAFQNDQYFAGAIDEVRIWNLARRASSIENDLYNKLQSNETGLARYYPLETFGSGPLGGIAANATQNLVTGENASTNTLQGSNSGNFTSATPPILIPRQVQSVPFSVSANRDQVILSPQIDQDKIEDVILNITAQNIRDLNGNRMASPVSWTAFVDQNTLIWDETSLSYEIDQGTGFSFTVAIRNIGGDVENFSLTNLPAWLIASTTSGSLSPLSNLEITFTIDPAVNTGTYLEDIILNSNSGVN
ncbi:MAG: LamG domain-containing protein, partial [Bacteroidota bacterium]